MQIIKKHLKQGEITVKVNNPEDLWYLEQAIDADDSVTGRTERKIRIGDEDERKKRITRKKVFLEVRVEKTEFHKYSDTLRISGVVEQGPEEVPRGSHHTFNVEPGSIITIKKPEWMRYQLKKLEEAAQGISTKILLLLLDREEALFALLKGQGHELLAKVKGEVAKKGFETTTKKDFYSELVKKLDEYNKRLEPDSIVVASPGFWREYLINEVPEELKKKITLSTCSDIKENAIREVMQRPELSRILENDRAARETGMIEELLKAISQDTACYGIKECKEKIIIGAVKELLVSYGYLRDVRKQGGHKTVESLMKQAEKMKTEIHIISTSEAEKKLVGLGGIAGILRWKTKT